MAKNSRAAMRSEAWWREFHRCVRRIMVTHEPVKLYISPTGFPTHIPRIGQVEVGTYTRLVSFGQLEDDLDEADREHRRQAA